MKTPRAKVAKKKVAGAIIEHHPPLYEFGGYKNSAEFFKKELGVDERVGRAYVRVAEHATPEQEIAFTVWKLDAAIGYLEATHAALAPHTPVAFERVKFEGNSSKGRCSARSTRTKRSGRRSTATLYRRRSPSTRCFVLRIAEANGRVSFHGVPNASVRTFAEVVLEARLPK